MKHEDYIAAIKKQQSLIRKLLSNRRRRSEVIDELTRERYGHLIGKFFRPQGELLRGLYEINYYICGVSAESNYVGSDTAYVELHLRYMSLSHIGGSVLSGLDFGNTIYRFPVTDDIDRLLAAMWVPKEKALATISNDFDAIIKNFLAKAKCGSL